MTEQQPAAPAPICPEQAEEIAKLAVSSYRAHLSAGVPAYEAYERAAVVVRTRVDEGWAPQCEVSDVLRRQAVDYEQVRAERDQLRAKVARLSAVLSREACQ